MSNISKHEPLPTFLDFEASSLSPVSYPIEVAWNRADGSLESYLISPADIADWTDWEREAEKVHGIPRQQLLAEGKPPRLVCAQMREQLAGTTVYSDAPSFDGRWLARLFAAGDDSPLDIAVRHIDELLVQMLCPQVAGRSFGLIRIAALKQEARQQMPRQHRAAWDVEYLVQLWRLARFEAKRL